MKKNLKDKNLSVLKTAFFLFQKKERKIETKRNSNDIFKMLHEDVSI